MTSLGSAYQSAGRREEAAAACAQALDLQDRLGLGHRQAHTLANIGNTRWELGELGEAVDYYSRSVALH